MGRYLGPRRSGQGRIGRWVMALICVAASTAIADDEIERKTLVGLGGVQVAIGEIGPEAERKGFARSTIQTDVELRLRQAGIPVLSKAQSTATPGSPLLSVVVGVDVPDSRSSSGLCAWAVQVQLYQEVTLGRDRGVATSAPTWEGTRGFGTVGEKRLSDLRGVVRDKVDEFINAYLAANPKR